MNLNQSIYDKKQVLQEILNLHKTGKYSWNELCEVYAQRTGEMLSGGNALRKRVNRFKTSSAQPNFVNNTLRMSCAEMEQHNADGSIDATKIIVDKVSELNGNKEQLLSFLGYDASQWELVTWRISQWDGGENGKPRYAVQYRVKPRLEVSVNDLVKATKEAFKEGIDNLHFRDYPLTPEGNFDNNRLMEITPVELHLGKIADEIQTGETYTLKIAQQRFYDIFAKIVAKQKVERCGTCLLVIGGDFFNAESDSCTSVHKIPQQNSHGYIKLFKEGIKMFTSVILELRTIFKHVDVMLCAGNHARAMETFLYMALEQRFVDDNIVSFIPDYKQTQCYSFGECAIFYNHGDANLKQIIKSIPAEFGKEWGSHKYRELHLGHLHKEVTVDDDGGMITRRVGSPCSTDAWHAENRFVGATKKHEVFIWHKNDGLTDLFYIPTK